MVRFKNRYAVLTFDWTSGAPKLDEASLMHKVRDKVQELFGEALVELLGKSLAVKYYNYVSNVAIIRFARDCQIQVEAAISRIKSINTRPVAVAIVYKTGKVSKSVDSVRWHEERRLPTGNMSEKKRKLHEAFGQKLEQMDL